jgi:hypothetical protein
MIKSRILLDEIKRYIDSPEAIVITGMRRTGKTTLLNLIYDKIASNNKLFLDLENPLNRRYFEEENYEKIKASFELLGIDFSKKPFIFLDEIQFVKNLPSIVKYFIDHYKVKFFLTGSVNFYLKNLFTESLAGRKFIFELFPLTFKEFLIFKDVNFNIPASHKEVTKAVFDTILLLYDEYLLFGGFPEVVLKNNVEEKRKALEDIFTSFFQLEVLQIGHFKRNEIIRNLILLLMQRIGSKLDIQRLSNELSVSRPTLIEYISFLEASYLIKLIRPFAKGRDFEIRRVPKVYLCDSGFANCFVNLDLGRLFENNIFQNLRIKGKLNYYQRKSGVEIDFILNEEEAYEVKLSPQLTDIKRLEKIAKELNLKEYKLISKNYVDFNNIIYGFMV